jgi:hypothetical protein
MRKGPQFGTTGKSKLIYKKPIHVMLEDDLFKAFQGYCREDGITGTSKTRELIKEFVETRKNLATHGKKE